MVNSKAKSLSRQAIEAAHEVAEEHVATALAPHTTLLGIVHSLTRYSKRTPYADKNIRLITSGGKLLALAASPDLGVEYGPDAGPGTLLNKYA